MKKIVIIALVLVAGIATANAQAKFKFVTETIDYGTVAKGSDGVRVFEFTNVGNEPLVITDVKSTCGCTVPEKPEGPIGPGKKGQIKVKYDTKNKVGPIRKNITVYSNADEPVKLLKIKGEVLKDGQSILEKTK
ncbi:DUF1573 domain-containing protein [Patiriisocius hiemis]|uniref:DUF1573 domain-containing protein n=1 Tax=Patiriisocius hiemis TaxID=3075604 RepID=A0ABU2YDX8_9FLAO|nr:DUF1573 domain-containing protein [Constantimarinum sp. W242]MDT0555962.1 DUF1573 domain-containing protein [Constantimarinum sp. W242]